MKLNYREFLEVLNTPKYGAISKIYELVTRGENKEVEDLFKKFPEREIEVRNSIHKLYMPTQTSEEEKNELLYGSDSKIIYDEVVRILKDDEDTVSYANESNRVIYNKDFSGAELAVFPPLEFNNKERTLIVDVKMSSSGKFLKDGFTLKKIRYNTFINTDITPYSSSEFVDEPIKGLSISNYYRINKEAKVNFPDKIEDRIKRLTDRTNELGGSLYKLALIAAIRDEKGISDNNTRYLIASPSYNYVKGSDLIGESDLIDIIEVTDIIGVFKGKVKDDFEIAEKNISENELTDDILLGLLEKRDYNKSKYSDLVTPKIPESGSVYELMGRQYGFTIKEGEESKKVTVDELFMLYPTIKEVPAEFLGRDEQKIQKQVIDSGETYLNIPKIRMGLKTFVYPLYHLDFETLAMPLPIHNGEGPHTQSVFQYSIHVEYSPGVSDFDKDNHYFLANNHLVDQRRELVEKLIKDLNAYGSEGSIVVWNESFEKGRIDELSKVFPEYERELSSINERIVDLMHIVKGNKKFDTPLLKFGLDPKEAGNPGYYHESLAGSYSLKKVLPAITNGSVSYNELEVREGNQAVINYFKLNQLDDEAKLVTRENLLKYCKLDTWAMFEILKVLYEITGIIKEA